MLGFFKKLFGGSKHERDVVSLWPIVAEINTHSEKLKDLSDDQLREKTTEFRKYIDESTQEIKTEISRLQASLKEDIAFSEREKVYAELDDLNKQLDKTIQDTLTELLPEAFAVVKETCKRLVGQTWETR
jgi:preprotein translocase subunit SecA